MLLSDFFKESINAGRGGLRKWVNKAFAISYSTNGDVNIQPWSIVYIVSAEKVTDCIFYDGDAAAVNITDFKFNVKDPKPPYHPLDPLKVKKGDLPNIKQDMVTTYGNYLANWLWCVYPFGDKLPYFTGRFSTDDTDDYIASRLVNDADYVEGSGKIPVSEYLKYTTVKPFIDDMSNLVAPSATKKAFGHHPDRDKLKKELLEKYKDSLDDPITIAKVEDALLAQDAEFRKGDLSEGFYVKSKTVKISRKKMHLSQGIETAFSDEGAEIKYNSGALADGYDKEMLVSINNAAREGSFDRGFQTQLGGYSVKKVINATQTLKVSNNESCGGTRTFNVAVSKYNANLLVGCNMVSGSSYKPIKREDLDNLIGRDIKIYTPAVCAEKAPMYCKRCIGKQYEDKSNALTSSAVEITSILMDIFMQSAHGTVLTTNTFKFTDNLR